MSFTETPNRWFVYGDNIELGRVKKVVHARNPETRAVAEQWVLIENEAGDLRWYVFMDNVLSWHFPCYVSFFELVDESLGFRYLLTWQDDSQPETTVSDWMHDYQERIRSI